MISVAAVLAAVLGLALILLARIYQVLPRRNDPKAFHDKRPTRSLAVFLGSGGHTAEMRALLRSVDRTKYTPRIYVYCSGDDLSLRAVAETEEDATASDYSLLSLPRARRVGEGRVSTIVSASRTLVTALWHTFLLPLLSRPREPWADILLVNGPGTAFVLVLVTFIRRVLGLRHTKIIYVESFARVSSLSLTGKLLRPLVDTFVVQWPDAAGPQARSIYRGWLV